MRIAFLNFSVFEVIFSLIQLSQDFKVTTFSVKINRCLFEMKAKNSGQLAVHLHSFEIQRKSGIDFWSQ